MKIFKKLSIMVLTLFYCSSCNLNFSSKEYDYSMIENLKIEWTNLFLQSKVSYFVYIYQEHCFYCNELKNEIISFALNEIYPTYFIKYSIEIPIDNDIENTINATTVEKVFIKGVPTLLKIERSTLTLNIAGYNEIFTTLVIYEDKHNS